MSSFIVAKLQWRLNKGSVYFFLFVVFSTPVGPVAASKWHDAKSNLSFFFFAIWKGKKKKKATFISAPNEAMLAGFVKGISSREKNNKPSLEVFPIYWNSQFGKEMRKKKHKVPGFLYHTWRRIC